MQTVYLNITEIHTRENRQSKGKVHPMTCHEGPEGWGRGGGGTILFSL